MQRIYSVNGLPRFHFKEKLNNLTLFCQAYFLSIKELDNYIYKGKSAYEFKITTNKMLLPKTCQIEKNVLEIK